MDKCEKATHELKKPWNSRIRLDRSVMGTIELSFLRGYQAGYEDAKAGRRAEYFVNETPKRKRK